MRIGRAIKIVVAFFVASCAVAFCIWLFPFRPGANNHDETDVIRVVIPRGASAVQAGEILESAGVITSQLRFLTLAKLLHCAGRMRAGTYGFSGGESSWRVLKNIVSGKTMRVKVTIPEGFTASQIANRLEASGVCKTSDFLNETVNRKPSLEGFLFPETYFFEPGTPALEVAKTMKKEFDIRWTGDIDRQARESGLSQREAIVLASIVEKEARSGVEKPFVASVFINRINKKWLLESCATVRYVLHKWDGKLTLDDLKAKSLYNTYIHTGLPPGPICNPGIGSIKSVVWPAKTNALFFLADGNGTHYFYTNYADHVKGKIMARRKKRQSRKI